MGGAQSSRSSPPKNPLLKLSQPWPDATEMRERKAKADRLRTARCNPISVPYEVTTRPEYIKAVQNCIARTEERQQSRWGPWNAWGGDDED